MQAFLAVDGPLDPGATLARYRIWGEDPANRVTDDRFRRVLSADGRLVPYEVRWCGSVDELQLIVDVPGERSPVIRDAVLDNLTGLGTGKLRELYDAILAGGGKFYLSGMSSKGRGVTDADLNQKPAEFATPNVLIRLALEHDRMFTY